MYFLRRSFPPVSKKLDMKPKNYYSMINHSIISEEVAARLIKNPAAFLLLPEKSTKNDFLNKETA